MPVLTRGHKRRSMTSYGSGRLTGSKRVSWLSNRDLSNSLYSSPDVSYLACQTMVKTGGTSYKVFAFVLCDIEPNNLGVSFK